MADSQPTSFPRPAAPSRSIYPTAHPDLTILPPPQSNRHRFSETCPAIRKLGLDVDPLCCLDCPECAPGAELRAGNILRAPLFRGVTPLSSIAIACHAREAHVPRHHTLFRQGEPGRAVFLVVSGRVKITQLGPAGDEVIMWLKGPGEVIGGLALAPGTTHQCGAESIEPCHLVYWDAQVLKFLSDRSTVLQQNTLINLAKSLDGLQTRFRELATERVAVRLARTLVRLHESVIQSPTEAGHIHLSREELAQMTGTTLFAVSRLLSEWTQLGILDARREAVLVYDAPRLVDFVREECDRSNH